MPFGIEFNIGHRYLDRWQGESVSYDVELLIDLFDLLAHFLQLGRCLVTNLRKLFGIDLLFDRFLCLGIPLRRGFCNPLSQRWIDVGFKSLPYYSFQNVPSLRNRQRIDFRLIKSE